jgi:phosphoserine aminotransferase
MKSIYFTVGPSQLYPTTKEHLHSAINNDIPSINHRGEHFIQIYTQTKASLRKLLNIPETHHIFFLSSAHESMERIIRSTISKHSFHFVTGAFSNIFYNYALDYGKSPKKMEDLMGNGFAMETITIPEQTEVICITQNETSTGIAIPMEEVYMLKKRYPSMLIAMDMVSSVPYVSVDFSKIDMTFFSVQKGFGLPAGLAVLIINDAALQKAVEVGKQQNSKGGHHGILTLYQDSLKKQTTETPNVLNIYLLGKIADDMYHKGIEKIRKDIEKKATMLYNFFDNHPSYRARTPNRYRSKTTIIVKTMGKTEKIAKKLKEKGIIIGLGYGDKYNDEMRIANFPTHTISQVKKLLTILKTE